MKILAGYPQSVGAKTEVILDIEGPASYTNVLTLGQVLQATDVGLKWIEHVTGGISDDALYNVSNNVWAAHNGEPQTVVYLGWVTISTGLEPADGTNLSGSRIRLRIIGF